MDFEVLPGVVIQDLPSCDLTRWRRRVDVNPFDNEPEPDLASRGDPWEYFCWYHGTANVDAVKAIMGAGRFDPRAGQRTHGGMYGQGLYLARTQCRGLAYGPYVFTVHLNQMNLLRVTHGAPDRQQLPAHVPTLTQPESLSLADALRSGATRPPVDVVADWALQAGYDGLYLVGVAEGTLVTVFSKLVPIAGPPVFIRDRCPGHGNT